MAHSARRPAGILKPRCSPPDVALLPCTQAPEQVAVVMDDGFNVVQYTFHLQAVGPESTSVLCEVRCCCCGSLGMVSCVSLVTLQTA